MGYDVFSRKSIPQIQRHIRSSAIDSGVVFLSKHAKAQMRTRKVNISEVLDVLRNGTIRRQPEPNVSKGSLECRMEWFVGGRDCAVVVALDDENPDLLVVTVWD